MNEPKANIEAEKKLLSSLFLNTGQVVGTILTEIRAEEFYRPEHRLIYRAIERLYERRVPIDPGAVKEEINALVGGNKVDPLYVERLPEFEYTAARAQYWAEKVREKAILRGLIEAGREIADEAEREVKPTAELLTRAEKRILAVTTRERQEGVTDLSGILTSSLEQVMRRMRGLDKGIESGYADLDKVLSFKESEMIILAARPSVGKTALALNMAIKEKKVLLFSLEMSKLQLGNRLLSLWSGVNGQYLNTGNLTEEDLKSLTDAIEAMEKFKFYMDDTAGIGLLEMRSKARRLKHEDGLDMIIIDYLQLMQGGRAETRQQEISEISRGLKELAREMRVPVIALSQLSRSVEMRAEKKPQLSDLRESGSLEQDADVVMFLYRDEYYNRDDPTNANIAEVIVAKNRNGPTTAVRLHFDKSTMKFSNLTREVSD